MLPFRSVQDRMYFREPHHAAQKGNRFEKRADPPGPPPRHGVSSRYAQSLLRDGRALRGQGASPGSKKGRDAVQRSFRRFRGR